MPRSKPRLGRGLNALLSPTSNVPSSEDDKKAEEKKTAVKAEPASMSGKIASDSEVSEGADAQATVAASKPGVGTDVASGETSPEVSVGGPIGHSAPETGEERTVDDVASASAASEGSGGNEGRKGNDGGDTSESHPEEESGTRVVDIPVSQIFANPYQPRQDFDKVALSELARSIEQDGVIQPVTLRRTPEGEGFELIAGERRWRATKMVGLKSIPAIIKQIDDRKMAEWAVIENLQREDLNPIERAESFRKLADQFALSHENIAKRVGVKRVTITNLLRLLDLEESVRNHVRKGILGAGHARALLGLGDPDAQSVMAKKAITEHWSVRAVEEAVRRTNEGVSLPKKGAKKGEKKGSVHLGDLEKQISEQLQTKVRIKSGRKKGAGTLSIDFYSLDEFDGLIEKLGVNVS